jgi:RimJ/RimL family protein N-acetyltransferase
MHYTCTKLAFDWQDNPPQGFEIRPMAVSFLDDPEMDVPFPLQETLQRWKTIDHPDFQDVGFVALKGKEICAWATVDAIANGMGDAGLVTQEPYRRKGLAAATTTAAVEQAFSQGIKTVHWTCQEQNIGSIKTAEKLGFEYHSDYEIYMLEFDEFWYLAQLAPMKLKEKKYQEALDIYQQALGINSDPPPGVYFSMARAQTGLGDADGAFKSLHALAKSGWKELGKLKETSEFERLYEDPQWEEVLGLINKNLDK